MSRKQEKAIRPRFNTARRPKPQKPKSGFRIVSIVGLIEKSYHAETGSFVFPVEKGTVYLSYEVAYQQCTTLNRRSPQAKYEVKSA